MRQVTFIRSVYQLTHVEIIILSHSQNLIPLQDVPHTISPIYPITPHISACACTVYKRRGCASTGYKRTLAFFAPFKLHVYASMGAFINDLFFIKLRLYWYKRMCLYAG